MAIADRSEGRRDHDSLHAGIARCPQHPQRAFARRPDQLVLVFGLRGREGRGDVVDIVAPCHRLGPAIVLFQIGGEEGEPIARVGARRGERRAHFGFARQIAHRGADPMPRFEEFEDHMASDEARAACHQDRICRHRNDVGARCCRFNAGRSLRCPLAPRSPSADVGRLGNHPREKPACIRFPVR
jgi:hypothetical protein